MSSETLPESIHRATEELVRGLERLEFDSPVETVYNPLEYAGERYAEYISRYGKDEKRTLFIGMNPGPWGMAQTGVPFGEVETVRNWLGIAGHVGRPAEEIPKRPVSGFECRRREVSGKRVWGLMRERFGEPENFFAEHLILNYCPLLFFSHDGKNITPDKLKKGDKKELFTQCNLYLARCIQAYKPVYLVGFGRFASARIEEALRETDCSGEESVCVVPVLHPSPANPQANKGWAQQAVRTLTEAGVWRSTD